MSFKIEGISLKERLLNSIDEFDPDRIMEVINDFSDELDFTTRCTLKSILDTKGVDAVIDVIKKSL